MPDIFLVVQRRWPLLLWLTAAGTALALLASVLVPKQYVGVTTALPVNSLLADKAHLFNPNIEALYAEIGTADELDKLEGTAALDTVYLAAVNAFNLAAHYRLDTVAGDAPQKAALLLKRNTDVSRTGYGELRIKVWDEQPEMAAALANSLMETINAIHQQLQTANSKTVLQRLEKLYGEKMLLRSQLDSIEGVRSSATALQTVALDEELRQYSGLISQYQLAIQTTPRALLVVEGAKASPWVDRPKTTQNLLLAFLASLVFSFLLAVFLESRKAAA